jgi:hypothetical protein
VPTLARTAASDASFARLLGERGIGVVSLRLRRISIVTSLWDARGSSRAGGTWTRPGGPRRPGEPLNTRRLPDGQVVRPSGRGRNRRSPSSSCMSHGRGRGLARAVRALR